jgi:dethiobiotin synthetase
VIKPFPRLWRNGVFVAGTDTAVGKTVLTAALVIGLRRRGIDAGVMKPVETGTSRSRPVQSDAARLRTIMPNEDRMEDICPYMFRLPAAPLSASRIARRVIDVGRILQSYRRLSRRHEYMLVEGAGGTHVPVTSSLDIVDIIKKLKLPVVLVGRSGLGGINHALLTVEALRRRRIQVLALVLNRVRPVRSRVARLQERSTVQLLKQRIPAPVLGPLPYLDMRNQRWKRSLQRIAGTSALTSLVKLISASGPSVHGRPPSHRRRARRRR